MGAAQAFRLSNSARIFINWCWYNSSNSNLLDVLVRPGRILLGGLVGGV